MCSRQVCPMGQLVGNQLSYFETLRLGILASLHQQSRIAAGYSAEPSQGIFIRRRCSKGGHHGDDG